MRDADQRLAPVWQIALILIPAGDMVKSGGRYGLVAPRLAMETCARAEVRKHFWLRGLSSCRCDDRVGRGAVSSVICFLAPTAAFDFGKEMTA